MDVKALLERQRAYFLSGATRSPAVRVLMLDRLYREIKKLEPEINAALEADLGKSASESYMCETGLTLSEISYMKKHLRKFSERKRVHTPLAQFPSRSYILKEPYGCVLIMSPWNYPFLLTLDPLADAIAAGNTAIVKPSAYSPATSRVMETLLSECFGPEYVAVVTGGREENRALLEGKFDMVFFTGSQAVGREVLRRCAEHLTPAVLELGGKSPCIVDETADIPLAARRIVFGKYLNCGQTCVAPDYVLCHSSRKDAFVTEVKRQIEKQFGKAPLENPDYGKIINEKHFTRLLGLMDPAKVVAGGQSDPESCRIAPTVMDNVTREDPVMGQEIFGPILPILTYDSFSRVVAELKGLDEPLALYLFSRNKDHIETVNRELRFGGGCINDVVIHLATSHMGFGGTGTSGMGSYHGEAGFRAFSHEKSMVDKKTWLDLPMRYQPYGSRLHENLARLFLR